MPDSDVPTAGPRPLTVAVEREPGGNLRVRVAGELDIATVPQLSQVLDAALAEGAATILLDLDCVDFIDSSGLATIVHADQAASRNGQRLTIRCHNPRIHRVFEVTGLLRALVFDDQPPSRDGSGEP
jgi:anti-sigma B factor antagonist